MGDRLSISDRSPMTEVVKCVFIPPKFQVDDILNIVYFGDPSADPLPSLELHLGSTIFPLPPATSADGRLSYSFESLEDLQSSPPSTTFTLFPPNITFNLQSLVFLGPTKTASSLPRAFLLEFPSGLYARSDDVRPGSVTFTADSILTLSYDNLIAIRQQLDELARAEGAFEERKQMLQGHGIDFSRLAELKAQYEESIRTKRRAQHEFMRQNQKMQAATIRSHSEQDFGTAVDSLRRHIEENRRTPVAEPPRIPPQRLLRFRVQALSELKFVFPFAPEEQRLCGVQYFQMAVNNAQWGEMRAFLGFATHYIREISRVVGVPLPYLLLPMAGASRAVCRLTEQRNQLVADYTPQAVKAGAAYEVALVACGRHVLETLLVEVEGLVGPPLVAVLRMLTDLNEENLRTLIPAGE
jgi:hypothetical protein